MRAAMVVMLALLATAAAGQEESSEPSQPAAKAISPERVVGPPAGLPLKGPELDRRTQELASIMRCPVCQALSVADSPTASALAMREEARDLLGAGYSREQVLEYFEKSYGEFILLEPKAEGFNLLVWLAPIVFLLIGAALLAARIKARPAAAAPATGEDELAEYAERVRREVGS